MLYYYIAPSNVTLWFVSTQGKKLNYKNVKLHLLHVQSRKAVQSEQSWTKLYIYSLLEMSSV